MTAWTRRDCLLLASGALLQRASFARAGQAPTRFAAAWDAEAGSRLGVLRRQGATLAVERALELPTRAHGLLPARAGAPTAADAARGAPGGALLAVARRPGDWLLRWHAESGRAEWAWAEPGRSFNGHVVASRDGQRLYTTETDQLTGEGLLGVRDAATLAKLDEWPTHGADPHELVLGPQGDLWVANGGIPTLAETGRAKRHLDRMDSSLVRLDAARGSLRGQWRLPDARLGLRHLAWGTAPDGAPVLGIALQAEHDDARRKAAAPVLALFDGHALRSVPPPEPLAGYGGGVAFAGGVFAVSCPRRNGLARFDATGRFLGWTGLPFACAVDAWGTQLWAAGQAQALALSDAGAVSSLGGGLRLDNHWRVLG